MKVDVYCESNFITNVYDFDIVFPKFGVVSLVYIS